MQDASIIKLSLSWISPQQGGQHRRDPSQGPLISLSDPPHLVVNSVVLAQLTAGTSCLKVPNVRIKNSFNNLKIGLYFLPINMVICARYARHRAKHNRYSVDGSLSGNMNLLHSQYNSAKLSSLINFTLIQYL